MAAQIIAILAALVEIVRRLLRRKRKPEEKTQTPIPERHFDLAPRVLLVDDNKIDSDLFRRAVGERYSGELKVINSGPKAVEFLENGDTDSLRVIVLDISMPIINGFDILRKIKNDGKFASVPVVMLTSGPRKSTIEMCYSAHANSVVEKKSSYEEFQADIEAAMRYWLDVNLATSL